MHFYYNDETFKDGPTSIQTLNYVRREPFRVVKSSTNIFYNPVMNGTDLYVTDFTGTPGNYTLSLLKYNIVNVAGQDEYMLVPGYTINLTPYSNNTDGGVYSYIAGDYIIVITKTKSVLVSNYKTTPTSKEVGNYCSR